MMESLLRELIKQFRIVEENSYHVTNSSKNIDYPYLTFTLSEESLSRHTSGFYIDCKLFDSNTSIIDLLRLEGDLKAHFHALRFFTDDMYLRFEFLRSNDFDTKDELIKRRNIQIYVKIDWRNINE